jgi:hypothetical protein
MMTAQHLTGLVREPVAIEAPDIVAIDKYGIGARSGWSMATHQGFTINGNDRRPFISKPARKGMTIRHLIGHSLGSQGWPASDWARSPRAGELSPR